MISLKLPIKKNMSRKLVKGIYKHTRTGRLYRLLGKGWSVHEPKVPIVIYQQLYNSLDKKYPKGTVWTRKRKSFIERDDSGQYRFTLHRKTS